ncbi:hypothetical protein B0T16DRAFT_411896 [Cercophora newfieldiana]|uniref:Uncharacterized protein n=1 Tax=Cercophora newfieldiana TaxID=92897 RepID=A0AA39Y4G2_9PEZI|nr:hypothetical protein B0T16DRAFT_411896 [Cercophora newfieldiana]
MGSGVAPDFPPKCGDVVTLRNEDNVSLSGEGVLMTGRKMGVGFIVEDSGSVLEGCVAPPRSLIVSGDLRVHVTRSDDGGHSVRRMCSRPPVCRYLPSVVGSEEIVVGIWLL